MSRGSRVVGRAVAAVAALAVLVAVSGCTNHLDAGTDGADEFAAHFRSVDGVQRVRGGGTNDLPFSGSATVRVVLDDGLADDQLTALVDDMGEYMATHSNGSLSWSGTVTVDGWTLPLVAKRTPNHRVLGALEQVRHDDRFAGGEIDRLSGVVVRAAEPTDLVAAWDEARTLVRTAGLSADRAVSYADPDTDADPDADPDPNSDAEPDGPAPATPWAAARWVLSSSDTDARDFPEVARPAAGTRQTPRPTAEPDADPSAAAELRSRVARVMADRDVEGAVLTPTTVSVRATSAAAQQDVRDRVARRIPDGVALLVSGGAVHRTGAGDYSRTDRIVDAVARTGASVSRVEVTPTGVGFVVADLAAADTVAAAVRSTGDVEGVERIVIASDVDGLGATRQPSAGFAVVAAPGAIERAVAVSSALASSAPALVEFPTGRGVDTELWLSAQSTADFPALARALRPLGLDGARTQIRLTDDGSVLNCTIGDTLEVSRAGEDDQDRRNRAALQDAWRAAG